MKKMTEEMFENWLGDVLHEADGFELYDESGEDDEWGVIDVQETGFMRDRYLTNDRGYYVTMSDGTKFQITIKQEDNR